MKGKKIFIVTIISFLVAIISIGWFMYNKGPVNIRDSKSIAVNADALYSSFEKDSVNANKLYNNKVVLVTGKVEKIQTNNQQQQVILLHTAESGAYINCTLDSPSSLKTGTVVSIKGICSGMGQGDEDLGLKGDVYVTRAFESE